MKRDFHVPEHTEDYVYMSQLLQAYGITKGIEAQRRQKPYNMGTLFWQLNDCWPAVSWSSIDYFGNWKALHYKAKRSFENVLISSKVENHTFKTWIINDDLVSKEGTLSLQLMDFDGNIIWEDSKSVKVDSNSSEIKHELDLTSIQFKRNETVLISRFNESVAYFFFSKLKELKLKQAEIITEITKIKDGFNIKLSRHTLPPAVFLFSEDHGHLSDNFFDLLPNKTKTLKFITKSNDTAKISLKSINNLIR